MKNPKKRASGISPGKSHTGKGQSAAGRDGKGPGAPGHEVVDAGAATAESDQIAAAIPGDTEEPEAAKDTQTTGSDVEEVDGIINPNRRAPKAQKAVVIILTPAVCQALTLRNRLILTNLFSRQIQILSFLDFKFLFLSKF